MFYLTGDTHGCVKRLNSKSFPQGRNLTKRDYVVILGDFGLFWDNSDSDNYWLDWLNDKPWTTLFIDGNHENFDLIEKIQTIDKFGADVGRARSSVLHLRRGRVYTIEGQTFFTMGGATSIDKNFRKEGVSWWPQEVPSAEEWEIAWKNILDFGMEVDYVLTHTCPTDVLKMYGIDSKAFDPVSFHLQDIALALKFKHWYHGHLHYDLTKHGKYTCLNRDIRRLQ